MLVRRRALLRKEPRQERASFTFSSILDAAELIVTEDTVQALQMAALARRAGVSAGSLYQYFPDRLAVMTALLDRMWERAAAGFRARLATFAPTSTRQLVEGLAERVADLAHREHGLRVAIHAELRRIGVVGPQVDISREWIELLANLIAATHASAERENLLAASRAMAWAADGIVDGASAWPDLTRAQLHDALVASWLGIASRYALLELP